jgi:O-Antigen ligase
MVKQLRPVRVSARVSTLPASPDPAARPEPGAAPAAVQATAPGLLLFVVVVLLIPGTFQVAGSVLSPYRVLLLALFPFLVRRWLTDTGSHPGTVDLLMLASCLWLGLSLVANHGLSSLPRATIVFVEMFGGYLVGRTLIRHRIDHKNYFRFLTFALLFLLPFVVLEALTLINIPRMIANTVLSVPPRITHLGYRLGIHRAQGTLDHPILFGLVASMGVANVAYIWRRNLYQALARTLLFAGTVFLTVSSGPLLAVAIQLLLTAWDRTLTFLRFRWLLLAYLMVLGVLAIQIGAEFRVRDFIVDHLSYSKASAEGRFFVFEYGMMEVRHHPFFGIGLNDWTRPWWRESETTFDNFWLGHAMRYGVPTFAFLALAWGLNFARIAMQKTLSPEETDYRRGYLIALTGLTIVLGTVNIWSAASVFVMIYVGAGGWFYMQPREVDDREVEARSRRAAQARAFGTGPALGSTVPLGNAALGNQATSSGTTSSTATSNGATSNGARSHRPGKGSRQSGRVPA